MGFLDQLFAGDRERLSDHSGHTVCSYGDCDRIEDASKRSLCNCSLCSKHAAEYERILALGYNHSDFQRKSDAFWSRLNQGKSWHRV